MLAGLSVFNVKLLTNHIFFQGIIEDPTESIHTPVGS